jgi:hypothetical protein
METRLMECGAHVGKGLITYPCHLDSGHEGPHVALENTPSVRQRRMWEDDRRAAETPLEAPPEAPAPRVIEAHGEEIVIPEAATMTMTRQVSDSLSGAHEALLTAAATVESLIADRGGIAKLLEEIEVAIEGANVTEGRAALSMLRAKLRARFIQQ